MHLLVVTIILFLPSSLVCSIATTSSWDIQTVDENGGSVFQYLAIDSNNSPHIFYLGYADGDWVSPTTILHASWNGSDWSIKNTNFGAIRDMVLDSNDKPHLLTVSAVAIIYASENSTGWNLEKIGDATTGSLAVDSNDNPHIVYSDRISGNLKYVSLTPSGWQSQSVDGTFGSIGSLFFELDSNDNAHLIYMSDILGSEGDSIPAIKYAYNNGSSWNVTTVVSDAGITEIRNLALDSKSHPHFMYSLRRIHPDYGYYTPLNSSLIYVSWNGSVWNSQTVASNINWQLIASFLALDSQDLPHVVFYNQTTPAPSGVLTYSTLVGTEWVSQIVDPTDALNAGAIALDSNGTPHISYFGRMHPQKRYHAHIKYAALTEVTLPVDSSPSPTDLLPIATILIIVTLAVVIIAYVWKKRR